jgi:hypothetical protein
MADAKQNANRLMNCIDIGKDAKEGGFLNDSSHGAFMKDRIIEPLFKISQLDSDQQQRIKGVGDEKEFLIKKIESRFFLNDIPKQQITRLISSNGTDNRYTDLYVGHDAGIGPNKLFSDYTLVTTPGTVLDPAMKQKDHTRHINGLDTSSDINRESIDSLGISNILRSVKYLGRRAGKINFNFLTSIPGFEEFAVSFNSKYEEETTRFFAGNPEKNQYIAANFRNLGSLSQIQFRVLVKELGDTLQVMWLKKIRDEMSLEREKTVLCTNDTVVWLRSTVNEVSSIFTEGSVITFYPTAVDEQAKIIAQTLHKRNAYNAMMKTNKTIIDDLKIQVDTGYKYADNPITSDVSAILNTVFKSLVNHLQTVLNDISVRANRIQSSDMKEYREYCDSHTFKKPFIINKAKKQIRDHRPFTFFLPKAKDMSRYRFGAEYCYNLVKRSLNRQGGSTPPTIEQILQEIPEDSGYNTEGGSRSKTKLKPRKQKGGENEDFLSIFRANIAKPGFLTYFIVTYIPEFIFIGYSYASVIEHPEINKLSRLFNHQLIKKLSNSFGKVNKDNQIDYYLLEESRDSIECDRLMNEIVFVMVTANRSLTSMDARTVSIFDLAREKYLDTMEFLELVKDHINPEITELFNSQFAKEGSNFHWRAIDEYQGLYEAEVSLTLFNKRDTVTPVEYSKEMKAINDRYLLEERRHTTKNKVPGKVSVFRRANTHRKERIAKREFMRKTLRNRSYRSHRGLNQGSPVSGISGITVE